MKKLKEIIGVEAMNIQELMAIKGGADSSAGPACKSYACTSEACSTKACSGQACETMACRSSACKNLSSGGESIIGTPGGAGFCYSSLG